MPSKQKSSGEKLDLNTASAEELASLPDLGAEGAEKIVAYREENGPFASLDELEDVEGFNDELAEELSDKLTVSSKEEE